MKKDTKKGAPSKILASCGAAGCKFKEYTMPYMGTQEDFRRHLREKFLPYKQAA